MSSIIKVRTFNSATETGIRMSNSTFVRPFTPPVGWTKLRLATRLWFDSGAGTGTPRFALGLCSGTTNLIGDATCDNSVGAITNTASWPQGGIGYAGPNLTAFTKVGSTLTIGTQLNGATVIVGYTATYETMLVVDITKGSPNYTLNLIFNSGVGSNLSISQNQFYDSIIQPSFPATVNGQSYTTGGNVTIAASEATGTFNGVGLWHNHSDFCAEILDLAVVNLS